MVLFPKLVSRGGGQNVVQLMMKLVSFRLSSTVLSRKALWVQGMFSCRKWVNHFCRSCRWNFSGTGGIKYWHWWLLRLQLIPPRHPRWLWFTNVCWGGVFSSNANSLFFFFLFKKIKGYGKTQRLTCRKINIIHPSELIVHVLFKTYCSILPTHTCMHTKPRWDCYLPCFLNEIVGILCQWM